MRVIVSLLLLCCVGSSIAAPPPAAHFGRTPAMSKVVMSPDGLRLAWSESTATGDIVIMFDLQTRQQLRAFNVDEFLKLRDLDWADADTLLITVSRTILPRYGDNPQPMEFWRTQAVDAVGESGRTLLMEQGDRGMVAAASIVAVSTTKPDTVIMSSFDWSEANAAPALGSRVAAGRQRSGWVDNLYEVDTRTGKGTRIAAGSNFSEQWVVDADGKPVARSDWNPARSEFRILAKDGAAWRDAYRQSDGEVPGLAGLSEDGKAILMIATRGGTHDKLWSVPLDGSAPGVVIEDPTLDVMSVKIDRFTRHAVAVTFGGVEQPMRWINAAAEARYKTLKRSFPGMRVQSWDRSTDGSRMLAHVSSPSSPAIYYLVDFKAKTADIVGEEYPELADQPLGPMQAITYAARDGYEIPAYLTLPPGVEASNLPLVVLPHGGPESRDLPQFDWWVQFLATRGYAVLQPQFRGSSGFGDAHREAGVRQWGKRMQDDVTDGVKAMIERRIADPRRICIVGASYGGYSALAGAAFTPEFYACAASINGVTDLPMIIGSELNSAGAESDSVAYWKSHIGSAQDPDVIGRSPARHADKIRAPVLLLHGSDDTVVPIAQSELMAKRLTEAGKPHKLLRLQGEDHWLTRGATRTAVLSELEKFLAEHLGQGARR